MDKEMKMEVMVKLENVQKSFGKTRVLNGVSFQVRRGEVVAIIGRSGSGKSTALRCIDRLEVMDSGSIEVCGHQLASKELNLRQLRRDVGIVFQSYNLFAHLTVQQNVSLSLRSVKKMSRQDSALLTMKVLKQVGMDNKLDAYPDELSGGQQQRVAIARSLAMEPQVMLFDEVTSALDPELTGEVLQVMEDLAKGGVTMVVVTHEMAFARKVADQIIFMHQGKVWETGPADILSNSKTPELKKFVGSAL